MDLSDISLQKLRLWSVDALKYFLSVRKLSVDGDFDELVARSWAAFESDTPVDDEAEQRERRLLGEYKSKLTVDGETYPDPATFNDGWLSEETGRFSWPSLYISDISDYLKKTAANQIDLIHRLLIFECCVSVVAVSSSCDLCLGYKCASVVNAKKCVRVRLEVKYVHVINSCNIIICVC